MIKCDTNHIELTGNGLELMSELTMIIHTFIEQTEKMGAPHELCVKEMHKMVDIAAMSDEEVDECASEIALELMEDEEEAKRAESVTMLWENITKGKKK